MQKDNAELMALLKAANDELQSREDKISEEIKTKKEGNKEHARVRRALKEREKEVAKLKLDLTSLRKAIESRDSKQDQTAAQQHEHQMRNLQLQIQSAQKKLKDA